jgi:hypothetical protein
MIKKEFNQNHLRMTRLIPLSHIAMGHQPIFEQDYSCTTAGRNQNLRAGIQRTCCKVNIKLCSTTAQK